MDDDNGAAEHRVVWDEEAPPSFTRGSVIGRVAVASRQLPAKGLGLADQATQRDLAVSPPSAKPAQSHPEALARVRPLARALPSLPEDPSRQLVLRQRGKLDRRVTTLADPDSARAAGFRVLRDSLVARGLPRVIAVSSVAVGDGKTTCAVNLAVVLAERATDTVLLIDGNLQRPALAEIFAIDDHTPGSPSLEAQGMGAFRIAELTLHLHVAAIVPSGDAPFAPMERHRFDAIVERLAQLDYDCVIIDAPAIEGSPAVAQLVTISDGVVVAVRASNTTKRALRGALDELPEGKVLGIALIDNG